MNAFLFPDFEKRDFNSLREFRLFADQLKVDLELLLSRNPDLMKGEADIVDKFFDELPVLHRMISEDLDAMFQGDPAAKSREEIIKSYPGFYAIASYRIAHCMLNLNLDLIPRIITEIAHGNTGIDIHPGATIGSHFCIDHGTGIVIEIR